jgi:putative endonuclease
VARNVRLPGGELDLIATQGNCLVFVEVRLRRGNAIDAALESVTRAKQRRLQRLVAEYCARLADPPEEVRIDVVAIALDRQGRPAEIVVIENAVEESSL